MSARLRYRDLRGSAGGRIEIADTDFGFDAVARWPPVAGRSENRCDTIRPPVGAFGGFACTFDYLPDVIEVGDTVRIGESGGSRFVVREVDPGEGRAVIEAVDPVAGGYPFSMPLDALVRVESGG